MAAPQIASDPRALDPFIVQNANGAEIVNPARDGEAAIWLTTSGAFPLTPPAGQPLDDAWVAPKGKQNGDVVIEQLSAWSNVPFLCRLKDPTDRGGRYYSNAPVHHSLMFGRGGKPFRLARNIYVPAGSFVDVSVQSKASALAGTIFPVAGGRWLRPGFPKSSLQAIDEADKNRRSMVYWLVDDQTSTTLTAGATRIDVLMTMPAGMRLVSGYFMWKSTGPFSADIYEFESGYRLTQGGPIDTRIIGGAAADPGELPGPLITEPIQRLNLKLNDLSGKTNKVYLAFHGVAVSEDASKGA